MRLYTEQNLIDLVESLKNYTHESHTILGHDERDAKEFVDIFIKDIQPIEIPTNEHIVLRRWDAYKEVIGLEYEEVSFVDGFTNGAKWMRDKIQGVTMNNHTQQVDFTNPNADKITSASTVNNKPSTAVEWLIDWMGKNQYFIGNDLLQAVEQAKEMEKQQIINAFQAGDGDAYNIDTTKDWAEQYYNEVYGK